MDSKFRAMLVTAVLATGARGALADPNDEAIRRAEASRQIAAIVTAIDQLDDDALATRFAPAIGLGRLEFADRSCTKKFGAKRRAMKATAKVRAALVRCLAKAAWHPVADTMHVIEPYNDGLFMVFFGASDETRLSLELEPREPTGRRADPGELRITYLQLESPTRD